VRVKVTPVFHRNMEALTRIILNQGGARSSKSHSIAQKLVHRFTNYRRKILVTRKTGPALTRTAYRLIITLLSQYGIYPRIEHNKTLMTIENPMNGSIFEFVSVDNADKIKSTEYNDIWMEEANEFDWNDFIVLMTRMSGPRGDDDPPNQITLSYNPTEEHGWINQRVLEGKGFGGDVSFIKSTYLDNPFLDSEYRKLLESLKEIDPDSHRIYALGEHGKMSNVIYSPYEIVDEFPKDCDEVYYGVDFGFNVATAVVKVGVKDMTNFYLQQLVYETGLVNSDLIARLKEVIPVEDQAYEMYCDAAEPDRIQEICNAGFNAYPADKEVNRGIDFCKRLKFHCTRDSSDLMKERSTYKWKSDKNGNVLDDPVKFMDHLMDAKRYAVYTHNKDRIGESAMVTFG
jgi:phage terminase large subunit